MNWQTALALGSFMVGLPTAVTSIYDMKIRKLELQSRTAGHGIDIDVSNPQPQMVATVAPGGSAPPIYPGATSGLTVRPAVHDHGASTIRRLNKPPGIGRRLLAYLIDMYGSIFAASVLASLFFDPLWEAEAWDGAFGLLLIAALVLTTVLNGRGQTLGKLILGIKLVRQGSRTEPVGLGTSALRMLCCCIPFQYLRIFSQDRKTLADTFTKSHVVRVR